MADEDQVFHNLPICRPSFEGAIRDEDVRKLIGEYGFSQQELDQLPREVFQQLIHAACIFKVQEMLVKCGTSLKAVANLQPPEFAIGVLAKLANLESLADCGLSFDLFENLNPPELRLLLLENADTLVLLHKRNLPIERLLADEAHAGELITHAEKLYELISKFYMPAELILNLEPQSRAWLFEHFRELQKSIMGPHGFDSERLRPFSRELKSFFKSIDIASLNTKLVEFWDRADKHAFNLGISELLSTYQQKVQERHYYPDMEALGKLLVASCVLAAEVSGIVVDSASIQQQLQDAMSLDFNDEESEAFRPEPRESQAVARLMARFMADLMADESRASFRDAESSDDDASDDGSPRPG